MCVENTFYLKQWLTGSAAVRHTKAFLFKAAFNLTTSLVFASQSPVEQPLVTNSVFKIVVRSGQ